MSFVCSLEFLLLVATLQVGVGDAVVFITNMAVSIDKVRFSNFFNCIHNRAKASPGIVITEMTMKATIFPSQGMHGQCLPKATLVGNKDDKTL